MINILVIKCTTIVKPERLEDMRRSFIRQKEDGVIVIPAMCEAVIVPDDIKIIVEGKE